VLVHVDVIMSSIHLPSTLEQRLTGLGAGAWLFLIVVGPTCQFSSSYGGYHLLQQGMGVSFQGLL
jgi:hypothetical protein